MKKCDFKSCKENATVFGVKTSRCSKHPAVIILDDNPLSIASYLEEFGDSTEKKEKP